VNLQQTLERGRDSIRLSVSGEVVGVNGLTIWLEGVRSAIGDVLDLDIQGQSLLAQVVGISGDRLACMPLGEMSGVAPGVTARATNAPVRVPIGDQLLGRVIDALGSPIDDKGPLPTMANAGVRCWNLLRTT
jgi:flagellum-specific ATP synthase